MALMPNPGRWRRSHVTDPDGPEVEHDSRDRGHRQLSFTFHPMAASTLCTVMTTDWQGRRRWDRRTGTLVLGVGADSLRGLDTAQALRLLLREALENLA